MKMNPTIAGLMAMAEVMQMDSQLDYSRLPKRASYQKSVLNKKQKKSRAKSKLAKQSRKQNR